MTAVALQVAHLVLAALLAGTSTTPPPQPAPSVPHPAPAPDPRPSEGPARAATATTGRWPLAPTPDVVAGFDPPPSAYTAGHRGVDLAGRRGQPVRTALGGQVTYAGSLAGRGVVVVSHGVTRTTYEPVDPAVRVGERVETGALIGHLQASGSHCAPDVCLHWGLISGDSYLDPLQLVGAGPVRLLPWAGTEPGITGGPGG